MISITKLLKFSIEVVVAEFQNRPHSECGGEIYTQKITACGKQENSYIGRKQEENLIIIHVIILRMSLTVTNIGVCVTII